MPFNRMLVPFILVAGFAIGMSTTLVVTAQEGAKEAPDPRAMILERPSPYGFEETINKITEAAKAQGWVVSGTRPMDKSIQKHGGPKVLPVALVELCHPEHAGKILQQDDVRFAAMMMPCTIAVYDKSDNKTYVSYMNAELVGKMFGGTIGEVIGGPVAQDQAKILSFLGQ